METHFKETSSFCYFKAKYKHFNTELKLTIAFVGHQRYLYIYMIVKILFSYFNVLYYCKYFSLILHMSL